jgi:hypothetical protein
VARRRKKKTRTGRVLGLLLLASAAACAGMWVLWRVSRGAREVPVFHFPTPGAERGATGRGLEIEPQERARLEAVLRGAATPGKGDPARRR